VDNSVNIHNVYRNARGGQAVSYVDSHGFGRAASQTPRSLRIADLRKGVAIRGPVPVVPDRASQGRVVRANAAPRSTPRALRTGSSPALRGGTARIPFKAQRERMRDSIQEFRARYRTAAAPASSNSSVRPANAPTSGATARPTVGAPAGRPSGTGPVARTAASTSTVRAPSPSRARRPDVDSTREAGSPARGARAVTARPTSPASTELESSPPIRGQRVGSRQQPPGSVSARAQGRATSTSGAPQRAESNPSEQVPEALLGVGSSSGIYAPRTHSRIGGFIGPQGSSRGETQPPAPASSNSSVRPSNAPTGSASVRQAVGAPANRPSGAEAVARTASSSYTLRSLPPSLDLDSTREAGSPARGARAVTARPTSPASTELESSPPIRGQRVGSRQQPPGSVSARAQGRATSTSGAPQRAESNPSEQVPEALLGVGSSSGIYAPRTHSRIGGLIGSQGTSPGAAQPPATRSRSAPRTPRTAAPSRARSPEGFRSSGSPGAESSATRSAPTWRPSLPAGSPSSVYAPRARSRVGGHTSSRTGRATSASGGGSSRPTFAPRTQTRVGSGSRTNSSSTSVRPAPRTSRSSSQSSSPVYAPSSRSRTSTRSSSPASRPGGVFSPRTSAPSRSSRNVGGSVSTPSSRSPSRTRTPSRPTRSYGGIPSSSRGSFGSYSRSAPRPSVSRPSVTRSSSGTRSSSSRPSPSRPSGQRR
jgi:hypothetical protein